MVSPNPRFPCLDFIAINKMSKEDSTKLINNSEVFYNFHSLQCELRLMTLHVKLKMNFTQELNLHELEVHYALETNLHE